MKETALKSSHEQHGARMVDFAGWSMPVQYTGILSEVELVRNKAGLFDLGHMGRVRVTGPNAEALLQKVQTNDAEKIRPGAIRYAMLLNEEGLIQDDILVYRQADDGGWFVVVNASNCERDLAILRAAEQQLGDVTVQDQTDELGMFAIQGPLSQEITQQITDADLATLKYYHWTPAKVCGVDVELSRTGYTGEDGFEVYGPQASIADLWQGFLDAGSSKGLLPAGLGSRDTLRLEAGMPLYGHEIDETTTPLEAGLTWAVKYTHDFTGRAALERIQSEGGPDKALVGLTTESRRVPRQGYTVHRPGEAEPIGKILSGAASPTLGTNIGTTYVPKDMVAEGSSVEFDIRGKRELAKVRPLPFYKRSR